MPQVPRPSTSAVPVSSTVEPVVRASSPMPRGYRFVPKGNPYMTRHCRQKTQEAHQVVYVVIDARKKQLGIRVPWSVYTAVQQSEAATRAERQKTVRKRDETTDKRFSEAILVRFPRIPPESLPAIISRATAKRKGRVGRTGKINMAEKVRLAVQAHIRHNETDYEKLLKSGTDRQDARALTSQKVIDKLKEWGPILTGNGKLETTRKQDQTKPAQKKIDHMNFRKVTLNLKETTKLSEKTATS
ncbi:hypothetical protein F4861DRAFT_524533 [Xylaria intraflava]|nr:hypothetical protein F4861DRAFT_524533 [Xylaria intraflava]